jgi:hypothetical protein
VASRKKLASIAFTGAAATLAVGMTATQALAAGTWSIKNGTTLYKGAVKAANSGNTKLVDTTHATSLTCKKAAASGTISKSKFTSTSPKILKTTVTFSNCSFGGLDFHAKATTTLKAKSYTGGVTTGQIVSTTATITGSKNNSCVASVSQASALTATYTNTGHLLKITGTTAGLKIKKATSCGTLQTGDKAYFNGTFKVSTPASLNITGP